MAEIIDLRPRQTELAFPPRPPHSSPPPLAPLSSPPPERARVRPARRPLAPQTRRLEISPEAWAAAESGGGLSRPALESRREGVLEALLVLLATVGFGLGWVAVEQGRVGGPASGYDAPASATVTATEGESPWSEAIAGAAPGSSRP